MAHAAQFRAQHLLLRAQRLAVAQTDAVPQSRSKRPLTALPTPRSVAVALRAGAQCPLQPVTVTGYHARMPGPKPRGDHALTPAERAAAYRERRKAAVLAAPTKPPVRPSDAIQPKTTHSRNSWVTSDEVGSCYDGQIVR